MSTASRQQYECAKRARKELEDELDEAQRRVDDINSRLYVYERQIEHYENGARGER